MPSTTVKKTTTSPAKAPAKKPVTKAPVTKAPATKTSPVTKTAGKTAPARKSPTSTKGAKKSDATKKVATPAATPVKEAEAQVKETPKGMIFFLDFQLVYIFFSFEIWFRICGLEFTYFCFNRSPLVQHKTMFYYMAKPIKYSG